MAKFKLGVIVGSNRRDSINRKLAQALMKLGSYNFDASVIRIDDHNSIRIDNMSLNDARLYFSDTFYFI